MAGWIRKRAAATGVMDASALLAHLTSSTSNTTVIRIGAAVEFSCYSKQLDVAGLESGDVVLTLPGGFRPASAYRVRTVEPRSTMVFHVATNGNVTVHDGSAVQGAYLSFNLAHLSVDRMPTGGA